MANPGCLFCRMVAGEAPTEPLIDTDYVLAIRDIDPRAPVHVLLIPKQHIGSAREVTPEHGDVLGHLVAEAAEVARREGVAESGYRLTFNVGDDAGMTIDHLHLHLLGGRRLGPEG